MNRALDRRSLAALVLVVAIIMAIDACSSDSTSPSTRVVADTVALNENNQMLLERYNNGSDTSYYEEPVIEDGSYVESNENGGNHREYRVLMSAPLPTLANKSVVDSARVYQAVCYESGDNTIPVVLDHVNWGAAYSDSASFDGQVLERNIGLVTNAAVDGWTSTVVTNAVKEDYAAGRDATQLRMQYSFSIFPSGNNYVEFAPVYCSTAGGGQSYMVVWSH